MVLFRAQTDWSLTIVLHGKWKEENSKDNILDAFSKDTLHRGTDRRLYGPPPHRPWTGVHMLLLLTEARIEVCIFSDQLKVWNRQWKESLLYTVWVVTKQTQTTDLLRGCFFREGNEGRGKKGRTSRWFPKEVISTKPRPSTPPLPRRITILPCVLDLQKSLCQVLTTTCIDRAWEVCYKK